MTPGRALPALVALLAGLASPAAAAAGGASDLSLIEVTPFYGYRFGGDLGDSQVDDAAAYGLRVGWNLDQHAQIEVIYSIQRTRLELGSDLFTPAGDDLFDLDVETWQVGGIYTWGHLREPARGFVGAAAGVNVFDPDTPEVDGDSRFAFTLYAGSKLRLSRAVALRLQAGWIITWLESDRDVLCVDGQCVVEGNSDFFNQVELSAGVSFGF
ncbi:MAG: hypothetical protein ACREAA_21905 [Candidatus Polarisedimenticolia bacterium]